MAPEQRLFKTSKAEKYEKYEILINNITLRLRDDDENVVDFGDETISLPVSVRKI